MTMITTHRNLSPSAWTALIERIAARSPRLGLDVANRQARFFEGDVELLPPGEAARPMRTRDVAPTSPQAGLSTGPTAPPAPAAPPGPPASPAPAPAPAVRRDDERDDDDCDILGDRVLTQAAYDAGRGIAHAAPAPDDGEGFAEFVERVADDEARRERGGDDGRDFSELVDGIGGAP